MIVLARTTLILAALCALVVIVDEFRHPQHMWIMNVVWPITCLYSGPLGLWFYFTVGRLSTHHVMHHAKQRGEEPPAKRKPFWQMVAVGTTHCGAGCTLGDVLAEPLVAAVPLVLWGRQLYAGYFVDFAFAWTFGVAFQYFTIVPMRNLTPLNGIWHAIKADTLSLTAWQIGMYGWMTLVALVIVGEEIPKSSRLFWASMQLGMLLGFCTSYPVNWWLLRSGIKEKM